MAEIPVRQLLPGTDIVGESIVWEVQRQRLLWVDIVKWLWPECLRAA